MVTSSRAGRNELVLAVQKTFGLPTRKQAEEMVAKFISCLEDTLLHHLGDDGFTMKLHSFGKFSVRHRHASRRKITFTGDVREIPPRRKIKFISLGKLRRLERALVAQPAKPSAIYHTEKLRRLERAQMAQPIKPNVVYHADWGNKPAKRWCARAVLGADGNYTAFAPEPADTPGSLIGQRRTEAGETGCTFAGFDFPIGVPAAYAKRAGISSFRALLPNLGRGEWKDFYSVCDKPEQICVHRPFYPSREFKGKLKADLFRGHGVSSLEPLLRRCERGGNGHKQACCLFWTLGGNQVGKAAIIGWREVLAPALRDGGPVSLWPFDGPLSTLFVPGSVVVAETWPAECYGWFSKDGLRGKGSQDKRREFGASLLRWADAQSVTLEDCLRKEIQGGFPQGDDAFDAVVGLFGMLHVCLGQREPGEPDDRAIREIEGWILGRES